jgi:hypothetical protein
MWGQRLSFLPLLDAGVGRGLSERGMDRENLRNTRKKNKLGEISISEGVFTNMFRDHSSWSFQPELACAL